MGFLRSLYYSLPINLRYPARKLAGFFTWEKTEYCNELMLPRKGDIFTGRGDFIKEGKEVLSLAKKEGLISPDSKVLDIGSGMGRVAYPLTAYLSENGCYEGFDVVAKGVKFCTRHISVRYSNFKFTHVSLVNDLYTAAGANAESFVFPYPDNHFDFAVANSLFTHLQEGETLNYLKEAFRTLNPGGYLYATFFLLNKERSYNVEKAFFKFPHHRGNYALMSSKVKAANVAFEEIFLLKVCQRCGFEVKLNFKGKWDGLRDTKNFQDILILQKPYLF